ncbi:MAG: hypothetical protein CVT47_01255 [Thermoplasmata archaeon HGW-Thermoplasmata-2]|nr:MAG: hypothetical protein CVT47_01255 [Thermoplasmata archaeon HGW-Thermoplasmata-2]
MTDKRTLNPKFTYTARLVKMLTKIAVSRESILSSPLVPKWEVGLCFDAMVRSAHSSTSIEGNRLSLEQVSQLARGREVTATRKDKQEVLNYLKVLKDIDKLAKKGIAEETILEIHRTLTEGVMENSLDSGAYRTRYVVVGNRITGEVYFRPPKNKDVPGLVRALVDWLNSEEAKELDPVLAAGIAHYEFVRIHPFIDGNGRTARALATLVLYLRGFDVKKFFALDDYYDSDRQAYYKVLQSIDQKTLDITNWLEYFTEGVSVSLEAVKERVLRLSSERIRAAKNGQIALTERQMQIVEFINQNGKITNRDVMGMFKFSSNKSAFTEIMKLVDMKVLKSEGKGRSKHYVLA